MKEIISLTATILVHNTVKLCNNVNLKINAGNRALMLFNDLHNFMNTKCFINKYSNL
jgi:hypothetical protein